MQLFLRRSKYVRPDEKKYWTDIRVAHMTEEDTATSDDEDANLVRHPPLWRSAGMCGVCIINYTCAIPRQTSVNFLVYWIHDKGRSMGLHVSKKWSGVRILLLSLPPNHG